ncbi:MAG: hypothetical protein Q9O74_03040 [Planctomycetota bacterium]|nr:hypothetical protein [Planctomycetota bacterium]
MRTILDVPCFKTVCAIALWVVLLAACPIALSQEDPITIEPVEEPWILKFEPAGWYVAANGNVKLPGSTSAGNGQSFMVDELNLDSPRIMPMGEFQLRRGDWRIRVMGSGLDTDARGETATAAGQIGAAAVSPGDTIRSSLEVLTFAADAQYAFYTYNSEPGSVEITSTLLGIAGIRAVDLEITAEVISGGTQTGTAGGDALQAHPYVGFRWELEIARDFTIDFTTTLGGLAFGDSESWSSDILVGFQWNPTPHFGMQGGYRQLLLGIETDDAPGEFAWNGGLAGVYAGATLRF